MLHSRPVYDHIPDRENNLRAAGAAKDSRKANNNNNRFGKSSREIVPLFYFILLLIWFLLKKTKERCGKMRENNQQTVFKLSFEFTFYRSISVFDKHALVSRAFFILLASFYWWQPRSRIANAHHGPFTSIFQKDFVVSQALQVSGQLGTDLYLALIDSIFVSVWFCCSYHLSLQSILHVLSIREKKKENKKWRRKFFSFVPVSIVFDIFYNNLKDWRRSITLGWKSRVIYWIKSRYQREKRRPIE